MRPENKMKQPDIHNQDNQRWVPGMLVECVDGDFPPEVQSFARGLPEEGRAFTIREVVRSRNAIIGRFSEIGF